jgi:DNA-directed RNA polymerase specialized sigma24 family protein
MAEDTGSVERVEKLLAALLLQNMKGVPQREKAVQLSLAGFSNVEIADLLDTSAGVVAQYLYEVRKKKKKSTTK